MAEAFVEKGYHVISNGTDNHSMLIDMRSKDLTGKQAEEALDEAGITLNKNMVPFDDQSPFVTSGIRIGTPAVTTRGLKEDHMIQIIDMMDEVLQAVGDEAKAASVKSRVNEMMSAFPLYSEEW
jgi:glycine hydroxymethyltransferase